MPRPRPWGIEPVAWAVALLALFAALGTLGDWRARLGAFQLLWLAAFAVYAGALARRARWRGLPRAGAFVVVVALALRVAVLAVPPTLSDDVWRYLWDGRVLASGVDPWRHAPADSALARLRDADVHPRVNHPELRSIYPPLAQVGFAAVARISPTLAGWKTWVLVHDLALCAVLAWWCARRGGSAWDAAVYAWNPLVVVEYAGSAHHEPTGLLWFVLALALAESGSRRTAPMLAAMLAAIGAVGVKLVALPAVAFLWRDAPSRVREIAFASLGVMLGAYAVFALGPDSGLAAFAGRWQHNDSLFGWLAFAFGPAGARVAVAVLLTGVLVAAFRERLTAVDGTQLVLRAGLLLGPVLHPWYLGWLLVLEPLRPSAPWLLLSCTVTLGYGAFATPPEGGGYHPGPLWRAVEYGLPVLLAIGMALNAKGRERRTEGRDGGDGGSGVRTTA